MEVYEIIGKLLAAFVVGLVAYLVPKARAWFVANTDKTTQGRINQLVTAFARAAEQLFHDTDPSGAKRQKFVREQLSALGIEITEAVINMIEGADHFRRFGRPGRGGDAGGACPTAGADT